jgi:septal ring factor EnvC (AmiA/AmiB activator)
MSGFDLPATAAYDEWHHRLVNGDVYESPNLAHRETLRMADAMREELKAALEENRDDMQHVSDQNDELVAELEKVEAEVDRLRKDHADFVMKASDALAEERAEVDRLRKDLTAEQKSHEVAKQLLLLAYGELPSYKQQEGYLMWLSRLNERVTHPDAEEET